VYKKLTQKKGYLIFCFADVVLQNPAKNLASSLMNVSSSKTPAQFFTRILQHFDLPIAFLHTLEL